MAVRVRRGCGSRVQERADAISTDHLVNVPRLLEVEDQHRNVILAAHRKSGHVHDSEFPAHGFRECEFIELGRGRILLRIRGVDTVNLGGFQQNVALQLGRSQRGAGVGREERVARSRGEDDDATLLQVTKRAASDEWLCDSADFDRRHDPAVHPVSDELLFQRQCIDDGAEHSHMVRGCLVDVPALGQFGAADDVAAADDDRDLNPDRRGAFDLIGDEREFLGIDAEVA